MSEAVLSVLVLNEVVLSELVLNEVILSDVVVSEVVLSEVVLSELILSEVVLSEVVHTCEWVALTLRGTDESVDAFYCLTFRLHFLRLLAQPHYCEDKRNQFSLRAMKQFTF